MTSEPELIYFMRGLPSLFALLGVGGAISVVVKFNLLTRKMVNEIQVAARSEGNYWEFWGDSAKSFGFLFNPESLLSENDSALVHALKMKLLEHRSRLAKYLVLAIAIVLSGFILSIASMVIVGLIAR